MDNEMDLLSPESLPLDLGELGMVTEAELVMPGVYNAILEFLETGLAVEAFIVLSSAEEISAAAKRYGKTDPGYPNLLVYSEDDTGNTRYIVGYELFRYKILHHLPLPEGETIRGIAAAGAEMYPEYAAQHNLAEQAGLNDGLGQFLHTQGIDVTLNSSPDRLIFLTDQAGKVYIDF